MLLPEDNTGFKNDDLAMNATEAQRANLTRPGDYLCQKCQTQFKVVSSDVDDVQCPNCKNTAADSLTPYYTEEDPKRDEMLGKSEFSAGD
jgi:protein-arginine kinase activator protein McsA